MGASDGPDTVSLGDVICKFANMISSLVIEAYSKKEIPPPKTILDIYKKSSKAVGELESMEFKVNKVKLLGMLNGFSDGYIRTSDPEAVKNINSL